MSIDTSTLRQAQLIMLEMLKEFDTICEAHGLMYWLDSGTILGAVRHKGFIPWDDDIDISMPLEDYNKFTKIAKKSLSKDIFFQNTLTDSTFPFDYMKLRSNKACIIEFHEKDKNVEYHQGVFVDIFPMTTLADTKFHRWYYRSVFSLIRFFSEKNLHVQTSIPSRPLRSFLIWTLDKMHCGWDQKDVKVIYSGKMPDVAAQFDIAAIFPLKKIKFEDDTFYAPKDTGHYLENIYTFDYMQLPPEEKRTIHAHEVIIL